MSAVVSRRSGLIVLMATLLLVIGCHGSSGTKVHVSGHVKLDGRPVEAGSVVFTGVEGNHTQAGGEIVRGQYAVDNVAPGKNQVLVVAGSTSTGGKGAADYSQQRERANKMAQARADPRRAGRMAQEMSASSGGISEKTMGNNQIQEVTTEGNQTIDINLQTVKGK